MGKENFLSKLLDKIKKAWKRLGEADIDDGLGDAVTAKEVQKIEKVQEEVKKQRSFVPRVKIDPLIEKYGEIKEGNPVYDAARKASQTEISIKKEDDLLK